MIIQFQKRCTMTEKKYRKILEKIAADHNITPMEVERELLYCIDDTWATTDPKKKARQKELFGDLRRKPTPKEFIATLEAELKRS